MRSNLHFALVVIVVIVAASSVAAAQAADSNLATLGVAAGQTARINISLTAPPDPDRGGPDCSGVVQLRFYDLAGSVLAQRTTRVSRPSIDWLEYAVERAGRMQIRPAISWLEFPAACRGLLAANVEVYNNATSDTASVVTAVAAEAAGDLAPLGVASSQTARINISLTAPPEPERSGPDCTGAIRLRFYDSSGRVLAQRITRVSPPAADWLEFTPRLAAERAGRVQIRPQISWLDTPPPACRGRLAANLEAYDNSTLRNAFALPVQLP